MTVKGIIFDLDGTLLYTLEDLRNSVNYSLGLCGLEPISIDKTKEYVGEGIYKLIERAAGKEKDCIQKCFEIFKKHYSENSNIYTKPYPNIVDNLKELKNMGIKLAILSNKLDSMVKNVVNIYFKDIFDIVIGESEEFPRKPNPKAAEYIIKKFNLKKEEMLFVGDSDIDINTAKNSGIKCISVSWGYKDKSFLINSGAKNIIDSFEEIFDFI